MPASRAHAQPPARRDMGWKQGRRRLQIGELDPLAPIAARHFKRPVQEPLEVAGNAVAVSPNELGHIRLGQALWLNQSHTAGKHENQPLRSEEHTSELQSLMRNSYTVFCLKKNKKKHQ